MPVDTTPKTNKEQASWLWRTLQAIVTAVALAFIFNAWNFGREVVDAVEQSRLQEARDAGQDMRVDTLETRANHRDIQNTRIEADIETIKTTQAQMVRQQEQIITLLLEGAN